MIDDGGDDGELDAVDPLAGAALTVGAVVVPAPSTTSTWLAATDALAADLTPNAEAMRLALAASPVP